MVGAALEVLDRWAQGKGTEHCLWAWSDSLEGVREGKPRRKNGHIVYSLVATMQLLTVTVDWGWSQHNMTDWVSSLNSRGGHGDQEGTKNVPPSSVASLAHMAGWETGVGAHQRKHRVHQSASYHSHMVPR